MPDFTTIKALLERELGYLPKGSGMDELLDRGETLRFSRGDTVIYAGMRNPDVYIVVSGIVRFIDMNGDHERTFAFALSGTIFTSKHSFVMNRPSHYQVKACCDTELLCISREDFGTWSIPTWNWPCGCSTMPMPNSFSGTQKCGSPHRKCIGAIPLDANRPSRDH